MYNDVVMMAFEALHSFVEIYIQCKLPIMCFVTLQFGDNNHENLYSAVARWRPKGQCA